MADVFRLKVAAAIALLRTKPAGIGAREYAEKICAQYVHSQALWRTRYLQAQDTILHLKQEVAISQSRTEHGASLSLLDCVPTPPPSGQDCLTGDASSSAESSASILTASHQFISSVINLTRATQTLDHGQAQNTAHNGTGETERLACSRQLQHIDFDTLLVETIPACARHLQWVVSTGGEGVSLTCVLQGLESLVLLLNSDIINDGLMGRRHQLLMQHLGAVIDHVLHSLFGGESDIQPLQSRQLLLRMLCFLAVKMRAPKKYALLHSVAGHAKMLVSQMRDCLLNNHPVHPGSYERLAIAFDCLHQGVSSLRAMEVDEQDLREIQAEVEGAIDRSLIEQFPLVAHELFRLSSAIELCLKSVSGGQV